MGLESKQGYFNTPEELQSYKAMLEGLNDAPSNKAKAWQLGVSADIVDDYTRRLEIINWVNFVLKED